ncbi:hypothetical protein Pla123a_35340 [Posidoniimonas polymericola]|uniref:Transcription termination/antitermination protein NusG n=1 Tax=Posidoniimonas polymericola TaxID=2528002 RepID=A0A5C5YD65_9BACT|nr:transcription termination/antitermination protein NusG [Posidoniimonas polymericola]TWT73646.1 hypothetical protein Pla123a_35340 [Posidoniimonas polymericola]
MLDGSEKSNEDAPAPIPAEEAAVDAQAEALQDVGPAAGAEQESAPADGAPQVPVEETAEADSGLSAQDEAELAAAEAAMDDEEEPVAAPSGPLELIEEEDEDIDMDWYILKVQSNRERSISAALQRKVSIEGLDRYFGEIMVPTEKVTEFKAGKKKVVERKIWPGYIAVQMHVNDDTWFAIRETSGIGDFTGSGGKPTPMASQDVAKILHTEEDETDEAPKLAIPFQEGDKVKVKDGNFESFEGEVSKIDDIHGKVTVMLSIFGRPTPVELEYWQVENL